MRGSHASLLPCGIIPDGKIVSRTIGLDLRLFQIVLFNTPLLTWLIRLSFSPTFPSDLHYYLSSIHDLSRRSRRIRNLPRLAWLYSAALFHATSFHSSLIIRSLSMPFRLNATYRLAPWLLAPSVISTNDFAYLPGLHAARPSAFVGKAGLEPTT